MKKAVHIYQQTGMAAEGHRHYPLRPVKALRQSPATLLPLCPFLDDWGAEAMRLEERFEVMEALVIGCQKVEGQQGYFRALAGNAQRFAGRIRACRKKDAEWFSTAATRRRDAEEDRHPSHVFRIHDAKACPRGALTVKAL